MSEAPTSSRKRRAGPDSAAADSPSASKQPKTTRPEAPKQVFLDIVNLLPRNPFEFLGIRILMTLCYGNNRLPSSDDAEDSSARQRALCWFEERHKEILIDAPVEPEWGCGHVWIKPTEDMAESTRMSRQKALRKEWDAFTSPFQPVFFEAVRCSMRYHDFDLYDVFQHLVAKPETPYPAADLKGWNRLHVENARKTGGDLNYASYVDLPDLIGRTTLFILFGHEGLRYPHLFEFDRPARDLDDEFHVWAQSFWQQFKRHVRETLLSKPVDKQRRALVKAEGDVRKDLDSLRHYLDYDPLKMGEKSAQFKTGLRKLHLNVQNCVDLRRYLDQSYRLKPDVKAATAMREARGIQKILGDKQHPAVSISPQKNHLEYQQTISDQRESALEILFPDENDEWTLDDLGLVAEGDDEDDVVTLSQDSRRSMSAAQQLVESLELAESSLQPSQAVPQRRPKRGVLDSVFQPESQSSSTGDPDVQSSKPQQLQQAGSQQSASESRTSIGAEPFNRLSSSSLLRLVGATGKWPGLRNVDEHPLQDGRLGEGALKPMWVQESGSVALLSRGYAHDLGTYEWDGRRDRSTESGAILGDDMGLGKTLTALMVVLIGADLAYDYGWMNTILNWDDRPCDPPGIMIADRTALMQDLDSRMDQETAINRHLARAVKGGLLKYGRFASTTSYTPPQRASIIVCTLPLVDNWMDEIPRYSDQLWVRPIRTEKDTESVMRELEDIQAHFDECEENGTPTLPLERPANQIVLIPTRTLTALYQQDKPTSTRGNVDQYSLFAYHFSHLIFDEAHILRNESLLQRAVAAVLKTFGIGLTGTPIVNEISDLWYQSNALGFPQADGMDGDRALMPLVAQNLLRIIEREARTRRKGTRRLAKDWLLQGLSSKFSMVTTFDFGSQGELQRALDSEDPHSKALREFFEKYIRKLSAYIIRRPKTDVDWEGKPVVDLPVLLRVVVQFSLTDGECSQLSRRLDEFARLLASRRVTKKDVEYALQLFGPAYNLIKEAMLAPFHFTAEKEKDRCNPWDPQPEGADVLGTSTKVALLLDSVRLIEARIGQTVPAEDKNRWPKFIFASESVAVLKYLAWAAAREGVTFDVIDGKKTAKQRAATIQAFNRHEDHPVCSRTYAGTKWANALTRCLFISLECGSLGINLARADYIFFLTLPWSRSALMQTLFRAQRKPFYPDQEARKTTGILLVATNSPDSEFIRAGSRKAILGKMLVSKPLPSCDVTASDDLLPTAKQMRDEHLPPDLVLLDEDVYLDEDAKAQDTKEERLRLQKRAAARRQKREAVLSAQDLLTLRQLEERQQTARLHSLLNAEQHRHFEQMDCLDVISHFHSGSRQRLERIVIIEEEGEGEEEAREASMEPEEPLPRTTASERKGKGKKKVVSNYKAALDAAFDAVKSNDSHQRDPVISYLELFKILSSRKRALHEDEVLRLVNENVVSNLLHRIEEFHGSLVQLWTDSDDFTPSQDGQPRFVSRWRPAPSDMLILCQLEEVRCEYVKEGLLRDYFELPLESKLWKSRAGEQWLRGSWDCLRTGNYTSVERMRVEEDAVEGHGGPSGEGLELNERDIGPLQQQQGEQDHGQGSHAPDPFTVSGEDMVFDDDDDLYT